MDNNKRGKAKEEKENHPFKHKLKVYLTLFLCLIVVLLTATYITYLVTHKDTNRNTNTYNENSNVSLIEKNMIDAFSNTKDTGKFSFSLSDSDINQMIKNASDHVLNDKSESIYYESKEGHHYFYSKYDYLEYRSTNQSLTFDFSYIEDSILSLIFYDLKIKVSYLDQISFEFIVTSY